MREVTRIRQATKRDISAIDRAIVEWLNWKTPREESIRRAIENKGILVAYRDSKVIGFIHCVLHEDIIDGGPNSLLTYFYVAPEFRNQGIGSELLDKAMKKALDEGAVGIEDSLPVLMQGDCTRHVISNNSWPIGRWEKSSWNWT